MICDDPPVVRVAYFQSTSSGLTKRKWFVSVLPLLHVSTFFGRYVVPVDHLLCVHVYGFSPFIVLVSGGVVLQSVVLQNVRHDL